jgi:hypothetical protein
MTRDPADTSVATDDPRRTNAGTPGDNHGTNRKEKRPKQSQPLSAAKDLSSIFEKAC